MKKSKKYDEYKNEAQTLSSMISHSDDSQDFKSQYEESQRVDKKVSSKIQGALTNQITD